MSLLLLLLLCLKECVRATKKRWMRSERKVVAVSIQFSADFVLWLLGAKGALSCERATQKCVTTGVEARVMA